MNPQVKKDKQMKKTREKNNNNKLHNSFHNDKYKKQRVASGGLLEDPGPAVILKSGDCGDAEVASH